MVHKEFKTAGKQPGLQIWRVENMDLVPVPKELYSTFYTGDAYLLLFTAPSSSALHIWIGSECTQDESGAAAIFASQLDNHMGGHPIQFREVQNHESNTFLSYFKSGVKYKKGGVASGFNHVVTNEMDKKQLLQVKGRRVIRATEVPLSWSSFNQGDCFIIDLGKDIYQWCGSQCNQFERLKASQLAQGIRDNERNGRAKLHLVDEDSEVEAIIKVLGPKPDIPAADASNDEAADSGNKKGTLYVISDATGSMKSSVVAERNPFKQDMLSPDECYILDNGSNGKIFLWKGPKANEAERKAAMSAAEQFIKDKGYASYTQIQVFPAGGETTLFKQFFRDWKDNDRSKGFGKTFTTGKVAKVAQIPFDASSLHSNTAMAAQHAMVDDGSGKVQVWRVENAEKVPVDPSTYGHFYGGDCYLILYSYQVGGRENHIIYTWQGLNCSKQELGASSILTVQLDDSMGNTPVQVRVTQGKEPPHLMSLFKGNPMIIFLGGTSREEGQSSAGSIRLFHIRMSSTRATRAVEVEPSAENLNTNDVFVLKTPQSMFLWKGAGSTEEELSAANYISNFLGGSATELDEGKEPDDFWSALGGKKEYQTSKSLQATVKPPRLFGCSNKTGRLIAEEVPGEFTQLDLAPDDVMILDTWNQIFVWIGNDATEVEKTGAGKIAEDYLHSDTAGRRSTPITTVKQGCEPLSFIGWFQGWKANLWNREVEGSLRTSF